MIAYLRGKVLDHGESRFERDGQLTTVHWLVLYQADGERPGEVTRIWTQEPLDVQVGDWCWIRARVRVEGNRLRVSRAAVMDPRLEE